MESMIKLFGVMMSFLIGFLIVKFVFWGIAISDMTAIGGAQRFLMVLVGSGIAICVVMKLDGEL